MPRVIPLIRPRASRVPVRRAEAGERRHEVDAVRRVDRARELLALGGVGEDAEPVAQPLDRGAAREDRSLERVAAGRGDRLEQPGRRRATLGAGVRQHEAARAVGRLRLAAVEAAVAEERRLLVAGDPGDRQRDAEQLRLADDLGRAHEPRQQRPVDAEQVEQLVVPVERVEVEQHRPGRVRQVGGVDAAAGQLPDEPRVDRAEGELVARRVGAREQPLELRGGEVRDRARAPFARGRARRAARGSARRCAGPARRSRARPACPSLAPRGPSSRAGSRSRSPRARTGGRRPTATASSAAPSTERPELLRVVLDPARAAGSAAETRGSRGRAAQSSSSTTRHVVPVVPWSIARITTRAATRPGAAPRPSPAR